MASLEAAVFTVAEVRAAIDDLASASCSFRDCSRSTASSVALLATAKSSARFAI